jgi:hypothetical protein
MLSAAMVRPSMISMVIVLRWLLTYGPPFAAGRLHSEAIHPLSSLTTLNLAGNKNMGTVSSRFFANLTQLEVLDFTDCGLTKLPKGIAKLTGLRALHLSDNPKLRGFPSDFWALTSLQELHARYVLNTRTQRTRAHTQRPDRFVTLCRNCLGQEATLTFEFGQLLQLKHLDISNNSIAAFPANCFSKSYSLEKLCMSGNALSTLAGVDFEGMSSLRELDLSHNRLTQLPPEMASLKQLAVLNVEGNSLDALPAQLGGISALGRLLVGPQNGCIRYAPLSPARVRSIGQSTDDIGA